MPPPSVPSQHMPPLSGMAAIDTELVSKIIVVIVNAIVFFILNILFYVICFSSVAIILILIIK